MRIGALAALLALGGLAGAEPARAGDAAAWQLSVQSDRHVEALPLNAIGDDEAWSRLAPRPGRNLGYLFDELRLSRTMADADGAWSTSLVARQRLVAVASEGALDLIRQAESSADPAGDRHWRVDLDYLGFAGVGLEIGRRVVLGGGWQAELAGQGLSLQRLIARSVHGQAGYQAADARYSAALVSDRSDDRMTFPFQQPQAGQGWALLLHAGLRWQADDWQAELRWRDAGWLHWRGLPQQAATLSSDLRDVDADGFVVYRPLVEGRNRQTGWHRTLAPLTTAALAWRAAPQRTWRAQLTWLPGWGALPQLGVTEAVGDATRVSLDWQVRERRAVAALDHAGWRVSLGTDRLTAARSLTLGLSWRVDGP